MNRLVLTWSETDQYARDLVKLIKKKKKRTKGHRLYGVPRGGIYAAMLVRDWLARSGVAAYLSESPEDATLIIDDIIDSGATEEKYELTHPGKPFLALVDKQKEQLSDWIVFPWELAEGETEPADNVRRLLQYIGDDPQREGLLETPQRVVKSYEQIFGGYNQDPQSHMKVFSDGSCDEMVVLRNVEFYSCCEHHMQPFFGQAHLAYIPDGSVIGVSKLVRVLEVFARRLQIQERIGQQWTDAITKGLKPKGAACILEAKHFCMVCRGVQKQNSIMTTSSLTGAFKDDSATRAELMALVRQ